MSTGNNKGRLNAIEYGSGSDIFPRFSYNYDPVGNITSLITYWYAPKVNTETQSFGYDELDRLVAAFGNGHAWAGIPAYSHSYGYDDMGNITDFAGESFTYQDSDHSHAVSEVRAQGIGRDSFDFATKYLLKEDAQVHKVDKGFLFEFKLDKQVDVAGWRNFITKEGAKQAETLHAKRPDSFLMLLE